MGKLNLIKHLVSSPTFFAIYIIERYGKFIPDKLYLKILYRLHMGKNLDLNNPTTFNEKLQWLKLYDRKPIYTTMVDKFEVKEYVTNIIGEGYVAKLYGVWDSLAEIDWNSLPSKFVLKTTHDGGGGSVVLCNNKDLLNYDDAIKKIRKSMKHEIYSRFREWPYKNVPHRIIAEELLEDKTEGKDLIDYKVMCFSGIPKLIQVHKGRFENHTQDFYDINWRLLPYSQGTPSSFVPMDKPAQLEEMLELSKKLSSGIPFLRVDWYIVSGKLYFGELTFFDASGFDDFDQVELNKIIGNWIKLN